jgi:hypothetical protein
MEPQPRVGSLEFLEASSRCLYVMFLSLNQFPEGG